MHIIFGKEQADKLDEKYTVLQLDTFKFPNDGPIMTAYCTVEKIKFDQMPMVDSMSNLHGDLITQYAQRNWHSCLELIDRLHGFWNGEVDSFYDDLRLRIQQYIETPPGPDWSPTILKD
jgi:hypothetical protein